MSEFCRLDLTCPVPGCAPHEVRTLLLEGSLRLRENNSAKVIRDRIMAVVVVVIVWRGGATGKAFGLAINRSRVQILLEAMLCNNLGQVVHIMCFCHQAV